MPDAPRPRHRHRPLPPGPGCPPTRSPGLRWYYLPEKARIPATGKKAKRGSFKRPSGGTYRAPAKGGIGSKVLIDDAQDRVQVCVSKPGRIRVSDIRCDDGDTGYHWYYIRIDGYVPKVGKVAEDGSFHGPYSEAYRARRSGGDAAKAAIDYDDPDAQEEEAAPEEETCTTTINGECVATNRCLETTNDVCTRTEDGYLGNTSRNCRNVFARKRWTRSCY